MLTKDEFYMNLAKLASQMSKDPITKVGAVIAKNGRILSIGYNGPPRGLSDEIVPLNSVSDENTPLENRKNTYMIHAELNSILNYGGCLKDLQDSIMYVTVFPCEECAKTLSQVGIKTIYYLNEYRKSNHMKASRIILDNCGVNIYKYNDQEINK